MKEENVLKKQKTNTDQLTDKAFSRLVLTSILGILVCIVCLCSTSYAWFSDEAPSNKNEIKTAGECLLTVTVNDQTNAVLEGIEDGVELKADTEYTVTLSLPSDTASGYCLITADGVSYYTDYIARHSSGEVKTLSFTLTVAEDQVVVFTPRWGIYAGESNVLNGNLHLPATE